MTAQALQSGPYPTSGDDRAIVLRVRRDGDSRVTRPAAEQHFSNEPPRSNVTPLPSAPRATR